MNAKTSWTLCFIAALAAFCYLSDSWVCVVPLLFVLASFGFLYNNGAGVTDSSTPKPKSVRA
tara:strand:- start:10850 stop:11035 length:186 start_codon:yes stop_codon:yes gene_type:complete